MAKKKYRNFAIVIERDKNGYFASCPELEGCYSQGKTYEKALVNIRDAIRLHVEDRHANKEDIPAEHFLSIAAVDIAIPA